MIQANTVITGDSLTVLRDMEADSVDMVITDPPYGIDYQSGRKEKASRLAKIANDKAPFIWWIYDAARVMQRIPDTHCNGDMHAALDYAAKIKHAQKDFLTSQGIHAIID